MLELKIKKERIETVKSRADGYNNRNWFFILCGTEVDNTMATRELDIFLKQDSKVQYSTVQYSV